MSARRGKFDRKVRRAARLKSLVYDILPGLPDSAEQYIYQIVSKYIPKLKNIYQTNLKNRIKKINRTQTFSPFTCPAKEVLFMSSFCVVLFCFC